MNETAQDFLARCFEPASTIALLLRSENPVRIQQRVVTLKQALAPGYLGWLSHENRGGANIYVAANPLRVGTRKRTKESIAYIRHVYLDIDEDGDARLAALRASDAVPPTFAIVSTSPGKFQVLWRVESFDFEHQETTLKRLAMVFGGDPACTDCNRVLRIPGFANCKYSPAYSVKVEYGTLHPWEPSDFRLGSLSEVALPFHGNVIRKSTGKETRSESDWAFICTQLANGEDAVTLTHELAVRRSDKPNPIYYAQRTVDVASARQWFLEGALIDDVINMLHERRRIDLPAALCSSRSREIATTARRMVARQKNA